MRMCGWRRWLHAGQPGTRQHTSLLLSIKQRAPGTGQYQAGKGSHQGWGMMMGGSCGLANFHWSSSLVRGQRRGKRASWRVSEGDGRLLLPTRLSTLLSTDCLSTPLLPPPSPGVHQVRVASQGDRLLDSSRRKERGAAVALGRVGGQLYGALGSEREGEEEGMERAFAEGVGRGTSSRTCSSSPQRRSSHKHRPRAALT